ncbi:Variant-specific surface protein, partial [Giardia duodenalis]
VAHELRLMLLGLLLFCAVARADCKAGNKPSSDGTTCVPNTDQCTDTLTNAGCATCTGTGNAQTCLTCSSSKKVRPDKKGCIASCPPSVTTENSGVCECTAGNKPSSDGTTCVPNTDQCTDTLTNAGCATCTGTGNAQTCLTCSSSKKVRPDKKGCIASCPPSVTTENSGVCECTAGNKPSSDGTTCEPSNTNKSGLSTGAIVGISVAAVIVVGGLVGFLCWWFLCRGKA